MLRQMLIVGFVASLTLGGCSRTEPESTESNVSADNSQPAAKVSSDVTFKGAFAGAFLVGAALNAEQVGDNKAIRALVSSQFNAMTAENEMKWGEIQPESGNYDWAASDQMVDFAVANGLHLTGHTLLWHQQAPEWVFVDENGEPASRDLLLKRLKHHIDTMMTRYKGKVPSWDVVNEALNEDGSMRESKWYKLIGPDYVQKAFEYAHQANPEARLYYNDYNLFKPEKRAGAVALVKRVIAAGAPVHGIGMQAHYSIGYPEDLKDVEDSIVAFSAVVDEVLITELDVSVLPFPDEKNQGADVSLDMELNEEYNPYSNGLPAEVEEKMNQQYLDLFRIFLKHKDAVSRVTFWGVEDGQSWRNYWPMSGRTDYPLLIGRDLKLKPGAYQLFELAKEYKSH